MYWDATEGTEALSNEGNVCCVRQIFKYVRL
jgi:hypothetical protein